MVKNLPNQWLTLQKKLELIIKTSKTRPLLGAKKNNKSETYIYFYIYIIYLSKIIF
jgi:hypothetical protein